MENYSIDRFAKALLTGDGPTGTLWPGATGAITVNLTALTGQEQGMARAALKEWATIANLRFAETTGAAQVTYNHAGTGAHTVMNYSGNQITRALVEIDDARVLPGDTVGSYVFRTYMHETGHALGLLHPQDYSQVKDFAQSAIANDSWQISLMSYFDQNENTLVNASKAYNLTPMIADYTAIRMAYGAVPVRAGDTVYGVGSTAGGTLGHAARIGAGAAFLVADSGGRDTLNLSTFAEAQRIDLRPGAISNVMGGIGNMQIAPDTLIEDATGGRGADVLIGNAGANRLEGGGGTDRLEGGAGADTYILDGGDLVVEVATGGVDTVMSSASYTMAAWTENLVLTGGAIHGTGNAQANRITGTSGANTLDGREGADTLAGGLGNDTYVLGAGDVVIEGAGGGTDTLRVGADHRLAVGLENLVLTGAARVGVGNAAANHLTGTVGANILDGLGGADVMAGGGGNDVYVVDAGDRVIEGVGGGTDTVRASVSHVLAANVENLVLTGGALVGMGNALANGMIGTAAANRLDGLGGADVMAGGGGNDVYVVDAGDRVIEVAGGGTDTVFASVDHRLAAHVEVLRLTGTAAVGVGNDLANAVYGTGGANVLDGGAGADVMAGGAGNDLYLAEAQDRIIETAGGGTDMVRAAATVYQLSAHVENLVLTGAAGWGIGNDLANAIYGTAGADRLDGRGGGDTLAGGAGNDIYFTDAGDRLIEVAGGGNDTVYSSTSHVLQTDIEALVLTGTGSGYGNAAANILRGSAGANTLDGKGGNDLLIGGGGADLFVFGNGFDRIIDFADNLDTVAIRAADLGGVTEDELWADARDSSAGVILDFGGHQLTITGMTIAALRDDLVLI